VSDLIERLRASRHGTMAKKPLTQEAADRIEELEAEIDQHLAWALRELKVYAKTNSELRAEVERLRETLAASIDIRRQYDKRRQDVEAENERLRIALAAVQEDSDGS